MRKREKTQSVSQSDTVDRRERDRQPPDVQPTYVWVSLDRRIQAEVVDESEGGIGVLIPGFEPFEIGFQVRVELVTGRRTARIVYLEEVADGCRVGLAWE